jgi:hypothetical protein
MELKDHALYVVIDVAYHSKVNLYIYVYIIMFIKQFSNIEEYVKYKAIPSVTTEYFAKNVL